MKLSKILIIFFVFASVSCNQNKKSTKEIKSLNETKSQRINKDSLIAVLDTIWKSEQYPIRTRDSLGRIYGVESKEFQKQQEIVHKNHAINESKVISLIDKYGWLGEDIIGVQGSLTVCNVIQHSDNEIRIKYLPLMKKAVKEKKLQPRLLVRAEDRIATEQGKAQIYGGQMKYHPETKSFNVWPVHDPKNVNKRRAEIGLGPIEEHLKSRFNFVWNLEEQIKRTEEFEKNAD
jgi:hypothetical protein